MKKRKKREAKRAKKRRKKGYASDDEIDLTGDSPTNISDSSPKHELESHYVPSDDSRSDGEPDKETFVLRVLKLTTIRSTP